MEKLKFLDSAEPILTFEEALGVLKTLNKKYKVFLEGETFLIESGNGIDQVQLRISLEKLDGSVQYPVEGLLVIEKNPKHSLKEYVFAMIDYLDSYWSRYLMEDRDVFLPIDWSLHEYGGMNFYLRGFVRNKAIELQADELLSKHGHGEYEIHSISFDT